MFVCMLVKESGWEGSTEWNFYGNLKVIPVCFYRIAWMSIKIGENARSMLRLLRLVLIDKTNRKSHKWRNDPTQLKRNKTSSGISKVSWPSLVGEADHGVTIFGCRCLCIELNQEGRSVNSSLQKILHLRSDRGGGGGGLLFFWN